MSLNENKAEPERVVVRTSGKGHERRRTHMGVQCLTSKSEHEKLSELPHSVL